MQRIIGIRYVAPVATVDDPKCTGKRYITKSVIVGYVNNNKTLLFPRTKSAIPARFIAIPPMK
jgi:hypothetical protein